MKQGVTESSGNRFIDLGHSSDEAAILQMRADLRKFIKSKNLTQAKAAKILGVSQSRVSDLIRGKWERFASKCLSLLQRKLACVPLLKRQHRDTKA